MSDTQELERVLAAEVAAPLDRLAEAWLKAYTGNTREAYERDLRKFARWVRERDLDPLHTGRVVFDEYRNHLTETHKPSTVKRALAALSSFFSYCEAEGAITRNPVERVRRPNGKSAAKLGLSEDERRRLLDAAVSESDVGRGRNPLRDLALVVLLVNNGLRVSEVVSLDIENISTEQGRRGVRYPQKGGEELFTPFGKLADEAVSQLVAGRTSGPIFATSTGKRMDRFAAAKTIRRLGKRAGIERPVTPHILRHTFCTLTQQRGADPMAVSRAAGHADVRTTMNYMHGANDLANHPTFLLD